MLSGPKTKEPKGGRSAPQIANGLRLSQSLANQVAKGHALAIVQTAEGFRIHRAIEAALVIADYVDALNGRSVLT